MTLQDKIPFDAYDFFAYLASGAIILFALTEVLPASVFTLGSTVGSTAFGVVAAYVLGHVVAQVSSTVLEQVFVKRLLSHPVLVLLAATPVGPWRHVFREFGRSLPVHSQLSVKARFADAHVPEADIEAIIALVTYTAMRDAVAAGRLEKFLRLYGFARNAATACAASAALLTVAKPTPGHVASSVILSLAAYVLCLRYLKFYRLYFRESLLSYSASAP